MFTGRSKYKTGRLTSKPGKQTGSAPFTAGVHQLGLDDKRDGLIYIPQTYDSSRPAALAVMLHGAGATAEQGLSFLKGYADNQNLILLAPAAQSYTWDLIANSNFGADVIFIDQALAFAFQKLTIDPARVAIGGFSDGASYALCLGLTNGDVFSHIIAFSPGFALTTEKRKKPAIFISHGVDDPVLPIDPCGRRIVPQLKRMGLEVKYMEFKGGHEIPAKISASAVEWFTAGKT